MSIEELQKEVARLREENRLLQFAKTRAEEKLKDLLRRFFGPKSEKMDPAQLRLALESIQADEVLVEEEPPAPQAEPSAPRKHHGGGRRPVPENLPVVREVIDVPESERVGLEQIREEVTEEIDYRPSQFIRRQIVRPVYASKAKDQAPVQAAAPKRVIPGSGVGTGLVAHVLVSRFCDHLPYYRLEQIAARQGVTIDRQKMSTWVEHAAVLLKTVYDQLRSKLLNSGYVQVDETPIHVMDPERAGATRKAWLWAYHAPVESALVFDFNLSRGTDSPKAFFEDRGKGVIQTDGYGVYPAIFGERTDIELAGCMAHARRMWVKANESGDADAPAVLAEIQKLYRIEAEIRDTNPQQRSAVRGSRSTLIMANLHRLCQQTLAQALPASATGRAASYMLDRWPQLELFTRPNKGHVLIDNNPVERGIRPTAIGRKNWLFLGHPSAGWRTAVIYSIIGSCKLAKVNPYEYLVWVLQRLATATTSDVGLVTPLDYLAVKEQR